MAHELPPLPYAYDGLEPYLDAQTMRIHHQRHHAAYVKGLNQAIAGTEFEPVALPKLLSRLYRVPRHIRGAVRSGGGGHANHSLFWESMSRHGGGVPGGVLDAAINKAFGSLPRFQEAFSHVALSRFGSGWVWLVRELDGSLLIYSTPNQDSPYMHTGSIPLLGLDVWEHAYYLKYQNRRAEYIRNWWRVVNWKAVADRYAAARI